jgi:heme-degrading monooxygenase HmoA
MQVTNNKLAVVTFTHYKTWAIPFAIIAMALFRLPLILSKKNSFYKLMGSGKNGSFDIHPDWKIWCILTATTLPEIKINTPQLIKNYYGSFIATWLKIFTTCTKTYILHPIEGHGLWDGKQVFGNLPKQSDFDGEIAILTRATIHIKKLKHFWKSVPHVAKMVKNSPGLKETYGIGEVPFIKQATLSIWQNKAAMKAFAYSMAEHKNVVQQTRKQNWYKEEMFVRFKILAVVC